MDSKKEAVSYAEVFLEQWRVALPLDACTVVG